MSNKMISQLNETAITINDNDYMVVDQKNSSDDTYTTKKFTVDTLKNNLATLVKPEIINEVEDSFSVNNQDDYGQVISTITLGSSSANIKIPNGLIGSGGSSSGTGSTMATPVGTIIPWLGINVPNIPDGYLRCNGSEVSQTEYSELFAVIGTKFGTASEGKFKLPKLDDERYLQGNTTSGTSVDAGLPNITGRIDFSENIPHVQSTTGVFNYSGSGNSAVGSIQKGYTDKINFSAASSNAIYKDDYNKVTPKSMTVIYLICAKVIATSTAPQIAMPDYSRAIWINSGETAPSHCIFVAYNNHNENFSVWVDGVRVGYGYSYDGNGGMSTSSGFISKGSIVQYYGSPHIIFRPLKLVPQ